MVDDVGFQTDRWLATGAFVPLQTGQAASGGTLVDVALAGRAGDQLASLRPLLDFDPRKAVEYLPASFVLGDPSLPAVIAAVDETAGAASLTVHGYARLGPVPKQIAVETRYEVRTGEPFLRLRSELRNVGTMALPVSSFGDNVLHGRGGTLPFTPAPQRGFTIAASPTLALYHTAIGRLAPRDGIADTDASVPADEVSYTIFGELGVVYHAGEATSSTAGSPPAGGLLAPGATLVYERRLYVGGRNDAASSADAALTEIGARFGVPMGRVRGRLVSPDGNAFRASITVIETDVTPATPPPQTMLGSLVGDHAPLPVTQIATDSARQGSFEAVVPLGRNELWIEAAERAPIGPILFLVQGGQTTDLGDLVLSGTGRIAVDVEDEATGAFPARITLLGMGVPNPDLGVRPDLIGPDGRPLLLARKVSTPYQNVLYTESGHGEVVVRPGRYRVVASHGIEYDMAWRDVDVAAGAAVPVSLVLRRAVATDGWLGADFHVHAAPSADSAVPPADRLRSHAAEGVQVLTSADHDVLFDYAPLVAAMGLSGRIASIVGTEATTVLPLGTFRDGVGHFNGWPLARDTSARKNGAPEDEQSEPAVLYDRLRAHGARVVQMNHPFSAGQGFLAILGFDASKPIGVAPNDVLLRQSALGTGTTNLDFDALEIYNGLGQNQLDAARDAWFNLLAQGVVRVATASSDSHDVSASGPGLGPGLPRTYVAYDGPPLDAFDAPAFDAALLAGRAFGTSGPWVAVEAEHDGARAGLGELLPAPSCCVALRVRVQAPCWMPLGEVRVWGNGALDGVEPVAPGCRPNPRHDGSFALAPDADTWYVVEVRELLPRPPPASIEEQIARLVHPQVRFQAFTNPIFIDVDGNGRFDPPGVGANARAPESNAPAPDVGSQ